MITNPAIKEDSASFIAKRQIENLHYQTLNITVPHLFKTGKISEEEYKKWMLDETGRYIPKLKEE